MNMNRMVLTAIAALAAFASSSAAQISPKARERIEAAYAEESLRVTMITNQSLAVRALFSTAAAGRWKAFTEGGFSSEQVRDFFCGAMRLRGPVDARGAIVGYYNPWWDAIIVCECFGEECASRHKLVFVRKVSDFRFLSGETFRGEAHAAKPACPTVFGNERGLAAAIAAATAETQRKFREFYAKAPEPLLAVHPFGDTRESVAEIRLRSAARLMMAANLAGSAERLREAWRIAELLKNGTSDALDGLFGGGAKVMSASFAKLPAIARADFQPYGYYAGKDGPGRTYVWINVTHPRLFAIGHLGFGDGKDAFGWFDLSKAEEIDVQFQKAVSAGKEVK